MKYFTYKREICMNVKSSLMHHITRPKYRSTLLMEHIVSSLLLLRLKMKMSR